jgi:membrane protein YdbS with pleckstrin-like domain/GNAT superfamily N-acetyltransferase
VIAAALAGLLQFAEGLPFGMVESAVEQAVERTRGTVLLGVAALVLAFLVVGWLISIVGAVVRYHGFTLRRVGDALGKRYGLLTVHEGSVPLERVQAVRIEEPFLRRAIRCASLQIETAGGSPGQRGGAEAFVPLAPLDAVPGLVRGVFEEVDLPAVELSPVHPRARRRIVVRGMAWLLLVAAPFWVARELRIEPAATLAPWLALLLPLPFLFARWQYRSRGWALGPGYLVARAGVVNRVTWIVPDRKLQTLHLRVSPFQRRLGLATLVVDTAAGGRQASIVDLAEPVARELLERLRDRVREAARQAAAADGRLPEGLPEGLPEAADANLAVHAGWVQAHVPGMTAGDAGGVTVSDAGPGAHELDTACRARLTPEEAPGRVREVVERFRAAGRPLTWWVGPADRPRGLERLLRGAGLERHAVRAALWADLERLAVPELAPGGLRIVPVRDAERLAAFARVVAPGAAPPDPGRRRFLELAAPALLAEGAPLRLYVGMLGGEPVGAVVLAVGGGVVGLHDLCTLEAYRGRGVGTALAAQPLLDAREEGARTAVVQAPPGQEGILARLGFTPYGRYTAYRTGGSTP